MNYYNLKFLSRKHINQLQQEFSHILEQWKTDWFLNSNKGGIVDVNTILNIENEPNINQFNENFYYTYNNQPHQVIFNKEISKIILSKLIPDFASTDKITFSETQLLISSLNSLVSQLFCEKIRLELEINSSNLIFGKYYVEIKIDSESIIIECPSTWLENKYPTQQTNHSKVAVQDALTNQRIMLSVTLSDMKIKASDALTLQKGNILQLNHKINQALELRIFKSHSIIAHCYLGKNNSNKSILMK